MFRPTHLVIFSAVLLCAYAAPATPSKASKMSAAPRQAHPAVALAINPVSREHPKYGRFVSSDLCPPYFYPEGGILLNYDGTELVWGHDASGLPAYKLINIFRDGLNPCGVYLSSQ